MDIIEQLRSAKTMSMFSGTADMYEDLNNQRRDAADEIERLRAELAAAQAREAKLLEGFQAIQATSGHDSGSYQAAYVVHKKIAEHAIAIPADHTALTERLAQEREAGRKEGREEGRAEAVANGHSHKCRACGVEYTPRPLACEDCPKCGCDGTDDSVAAIRVLRSMK